MTEDGIKILYAVFEGLMPDGTSVGYSTSTGTDTEPEALEEISQFGIRALEMMYPGVRGAAQIGPWETTVIPRADETTEEES